MRRSGRSMNRNDRDRGAEMRLLHSISSQCLGFILHTSLRELTSAVFQGAATPYEGQNGATGEGEIRHLGWPTVRVSQMMEAQSS